MNVVTELLADKRTLTEIKQFCLKNRDGTADWILQQYFPGTLKEVYVKPESNKVSIWRFSKALLDNFQSK